MGGGLPQRKEVAVADLEVHDAAHAGADDTGRAMRNRERQLQPGLPQRFIGGGGGEQAVAIGVENESVPVEVFEAAFGIEAFDLGGDPDFEIEAFDLGRQQDVRLVLREAVERANARLAPLEGRPKIGHGLADRGDNPHAGHDHSSAGARLCHVGPACPFLASNVRRPFSAFNVSRIKISFAT